MNASIAAIVINIAAKAWGGSTSDSCIDPIKNFCQRLWHQSAVKNNTLYINGGMEVFIPKNNAETERGDKDLLTGNADEYIITVDLTAFWNWKTNISITALNKTENQKTGTQQPNNIRGALYAGAYGNPDLYLYGGTVSWANRSFPGSQWPTAATYSLWGYGTSDKTWDQYDVSLNVPNRPAGGAPAEATERGLAFYLGGFMNNGSKQHHNTIEELPSRPGWAGLCPQLRVGRDPSANGWENKNDYISFETVDFLDIASIDHEKSSGTWCTQTTTGDILDARINFCVIAVSAPDNSSQSIYLYGGKGEYGVFDQTYVLSVPSFRWIRLLEGESPRHGHTCHVVGNSQMLTVGVARHENVSQRCDWDLKSVAILNSNHITWGSVFAENTGRFTVPTAIYRVIGGGGGNAFEIRPSTGFSGKDAAAFFSQADAITDNSNDNHLRGGGIAGVNLLQGIIPQSGPKDRARPPRHEMERPIPHEIEARSPHEMDGQGVLAEFPARTSEEKKDT
ncbi:hypothetical protein N7492_007082 [Penicillium capsulatum]|uniref:Kelch repeat protein n=1 Tax=Penicillium capsulatum TaxID=69766 RepID=A0A9W9LKY5_9EURO|nr:hypothetical protein N7492_007082 [Penicillium capsulatum]